MDDMKAALSAKGYDLVEKDEDDSDSDFDPIPGRIPSLEPGLAKEKGKKAFEAGKYDKAIKCWQGGLKSILSALCAGPQAMSDTNLSELDLTLNLNIAMAYMKKGDFDGADRSVDKALARREALPPQLVTKALYRKASAQRAMHRLEECLATLKDLLEVEEGHAAARQMKQEVDREWGLQIRAQKKNMAKMFSKMGDEDRKEENRVRVDRAEARRHCGVKWLDTDVDSEAFELGETPACDGRDWGLALCRTVLWSIEQLAVEGHPCVTAETGDRASAWFIGASSTCELRWLQPAILMARMPELQSLELTLIGFLGELDPENKREPDPNADNLPQGVQQYEIDGGRRVFKRSIKSSLQDAVANELKPTQQEAGDALKWRAHHENSSEAGDAREVEAAVPSGDAAETAAPVVGLEEAALAQAYGVSAETEQAAAPVAPPPQVPPTVCFIAHPQLHRYFSDFHPAISWLIQNNVPTVLLGASEPDPSWKQDEVLLKALGANIIVGKRASPYPMCLPDNPNIKKCSHIIGFRGGKALEKEKLTKTKIELLSQDNSVR